MDLTAYVTGIVWFANTYIIPFIIGIAFLFFIINAIRFFVIGGSSDEGREKARSLALYGVLAFVFIIIFWGIVNMFSSSLGLTRLGYTTPNCFDYDPKCLSGNPSDRTTSTVGGSSGIAGEEVTPSGAVVGNTIGDPRSAEVGRGTGLPKTGGVSIDAEDPELPRIQLPGGLANPGAPLDTDFDTSGIAADIAMSPTTLAAAVEQVEDTATEFASNLDEQYNSRVATIIADSVSTLTDPNASILDRGMAATRLNAYNKGTSEQALDDDTYRLYLDALNAEARETGLGTVSAQPLKDSLGIPLTTGIEPEENDGEATSYIKFTNRQLMNELVSVNSGFFTRQSVATAKAEEDFAQIMQAPAGEERLQAFDQLVATGKFASDDRTAVLRQRLVDDSNLQLFYAGKPPI